MTSQNLVSISIHLLIIALNIRNSLQSNQSIKQSDGNQENCTRQKLDDFHDCLKNALEKIKINHRAVNTGVQKCFQENGCNQPDFDAPNPSSSPDQRLQQSQFKNIDWKKFYECKVNVNRKVREKVEACVIANYIGTREFHTIDEDFNFDGELDAEVATNVSLGLNAMGKLIDEQSICDKSVDKDKLKQCIGRVLDENRPFKTMDDKWRLYHAYCETRDECRAKLNSECQQQLKDIHRYLCECSHIQMSSTNVIAWTNDFLSCTQVDMGERDKIAGEPMANPHVIYAESFCHVPRDPCDWLWIDYPYRPPTAGAMQSTTDTLTGQNEAGKVHTVYHDPVQPISFYKNETDGQLGNMLLNAFNNHEIDRLRSALDTFMYPTNISDIIIGGDDLTSLMSRLINGSEADRIAEIGAQFFRYQRQLNQSIDFMDIDAMVAKLLDPSEVEKLQRALYEFAFPNGNATIRNESISQSLGSMMTDLRAQADDARLLQVVDAFQHPFRSSTAGVPIDVAALRKSGEIANDSTRINF